MVDILKRALIPELLKIIAKARAGLPGGVQSLIGQAQTFLPTTIEKATALYTKAVSGIGAWLPSQAPAVTRTGGRLLSWLEAQAKKL